MAATARTDPPVSENQRKAMRAAAAGNSTLGIPESVGKEFSEADPGGKLPAKSISDRLDACQAALDDLSRRMDGVEKRVTASGRMDGRYEELEKRYFGNGKPLSEAEGEEFIRLENAREAERKRSVGSKPIPQGNFRVTTGPTPWRNPIMFGGRR